MILHLSPVWTLVIDFTAWLAIHVGVSVWLYYLRPELFNPESWLYRARLWESNGRLYQTIFKVKTWKKFLPDGAAVAKNGFRKNHLGSRQAGYLHRFISETCRAELTHWIIGVSWPVFFIWNDWSITLIMLAYAIIVNIPCIISQRYNRIRLKSALCQITERK